MNEKQVDSKELTASMPGWFKASPIGITILVETAAREAADRKTTVTRLVAVRAERASVCRHSNAPRRPPASARKRRKRSCDSQSRNMPPQKESAGCGKSGSPCRSSG
jgi:hypothetical protein